MHEPRPPQPRSRPVATPSRLGAVHAGLAACLLVVSGMTAAQSLPADRAENAVAPRARAGMVRPLSGASVTLADVEAAVRADAAQAWQLAGGGVLQVRTEDVDWADGSLGCARPGMTYTMALQPGWRLVVRYQQREAVYHASRRGQWLLCPGGAAGLPPVGAASR